MRLSRPVIAKARSACGDPVAAMLAWIAASLGHYAKLLAMMFLLSATPALAVGVDPEALDKPELEAKARTIMAGVRCLVCQNQSIEDSNADLAKDLRALVREQVAAGKDQTEIEEFLVARYGDWVLLDPPVNQTTAALYIAPFILILLAISGLWAQRRRKVPNVDFGNEEAAEVERLLKGDDS